MLEGRSQPGRTPKLGSCGLHREGSPGSQYQTGWSREGHALFPSSQGGIYTLMDLSLGGHNHAARGEGIVGSHPHPLDLSPSSEEEDAFPCSKHLHKG